MEEYIPVMAVNQDVKGDIAAERIVLAGLLNYGHTTYLDISGIVSSETFTDPGNQIIYKCIDQFFINDPEGHIDLASLVATGRQMGFDTFFDKKQELQQIKVLKDTPVSEVNAVKFAGVIKKIEIAKQLQAKLKYAYGLLGTINGRESVTDILGIPEDVIFDYAAGFRETGANEPDRFGDGIVEYIEYLAENQKQLIGVPTGYPKFDAAIGGGLRRKTNTTIGARPKTGKSIIANNVAEHVSSLDIPVLYLDTEMDKEDQWARYIASKSKVSISDVERGKYGQDRIALENVRKAAKSMENRRLYYINIAGMNIKETLSIARRWVLKTVGFNDDDIVNDCLVILDYLKVMDAKELTSSVQEYQKLGFMMTDIHNFAVKYDVPFLTLLQLNRDGITKEGTDAAGGSDRIIHLCSSFSIFKNKTAEEIGNDGAHEGNCKFVPVVARHGAGMREGDYINAFREGDISKISEGKTHSEILIEQQDNTDDQEYIEVE